MRSLRPEVEVLDAEPESAGGCLVKFHPDMVVCSTATEAVRAAPVWVELYPGHEPVSVVSVSGRREEIENIELRKLLELVDQADDIAQRS